MSFNGEVIRMEQDKDAIKNMAFTFGVEAAFKGRAIASNPYQTFSADYKLWRMGWMDHVISEQKTHQRTPVGIPPS